MQQLKDDYFKTGFIHIKNFFDPAEVDAIRKSARAIFVRQFKRLGLLDDDHSEASFEKAMYTFFEKDLTAFIGCGKQAQHLIDLHRLSLDAKLVDLLKELGLKTPVISTRPVLFFNSRNLAKKESYWKTPPHQDWRSIQGSINSIVVWVPLIDIDKALGAIEVIPGSHLNGLVTEDTVDSFGVVSEPYKAEHDFQSVPVSQGDIVLFSQFLVHRSGNNVTDSIRWSCHFRYNDLDEATFINRGYPHTYIYKPDNTLLFPELDTRQLVQTHFKTHEDY